MTDNDDTRVEGGQGTGDVPVDEAPPFGNISSPVQALTTMDQAEEVWTVAEMESAEPCDIIEIDEEAVDAADTLAEDEAARLIPGGEPEDVDEPGPESGGDIELLGYSYPAPFTRWENFADYNLWPYRAVGKLFFKQGGKSFVCSASSIGGCAIITAGHCVHQGDN